MFMFHLSKESSPSLEGKPRYPSSKAHAEGFEVWGESVDVWELTVSEVHNFRSEHIDKRPVSNSCKSMPGQVFFFFKLLFCVNKDSAQIALNKSHIIHFQWIIHWNGMGLD